MGYFFEIPYTTEEIDCIIGVTDIFDDNYDFDVLDINGNISQELADRLTEFDHWDIEALIEQEIKEMVLKQQQENSYDEF